MTFSAFFGKKTRILLVCLLALVMLSMLCLTVGAVKDEQILLTLDPNTLEKIQEEKGDFTLPIGDFTLVNNASAQTLVDVNDGTYSGKAIRFTSGILRFDDTNHVLDDYQAVAVSADFYFTKFPTGTRTEESKETGEMETFSCEFGTEHNFRSQSVLAWAGNVNGNLLFDGLRIDSEGNLYSSTNLSTAIGVKLEKNTWYNLKLVYSKISDRTEIFVNDERVATTSVRFREHSNYVRLFDGSFSYNVYAKNVSISASHTPYYTGIVKEESSDFVSYQTTKPDGGSFKLRIIAGINDLSVPTFGYKVVKLTKDANGNTVSELLTGTDDKAYSAIYGGETPYRIKDLFGYSYACLATVPDLQENSKYTELVIFPYTVSFAGNKVYGTPISLVYTGKTDDGYPLFDTVTPSLQTNLAPTDDTFISKLSTHVNNPQGNASPLYVRNTYDETNDPIYRSAYFKFTIPKETVDRLDSMAHVFLNVNVSYEPDESRVKEPLAVFGTTTDWEEETLTYTLHQSNNIAIRDTEPITSIPGEECSGYIKFDVLDYVQKQAKTATNADGSLTVSFCVTQDDKSTQTAPRMIYVYSKEHGEINGKSVAPYLCLVESLYRHDITNVKSENVGYEPLGYAEKLVDTWFDKIYPEIYLDENGDPLYHSAADAFNPTGYAATSKTGDFKHEIVWKAGMPWYSKVTTNKLSNFVLHKDKWNEAPYTSRFARTLSTLENSTSNPYKKTTTTDYDAYGGITNLPTSEGTMLKGTATGYFHTEKIDGRTYIIDPLGNPYFAVSINTVVYGDTQNQKVYVDEAYDSSDAFFTQISASLRDIGVNTAFVSSSDELLAVTENGLAVTVSVNGIGGYMGKLGRSQVSEGLFPNNNTINVFDPDFATYVNQQNKALIQEKGYADMPNLFGYASDNELPSGVTILERYLTIDPSIPENIFSYQTAWAWLARKMNTPNPSLSLLRDLSAEDYAAYNSEFLGFVYAMYYKTVSESVKAADPHHMYIGSRVNGNCPYDEGYLRAAGKYLDLITINLYDGLNPNSTTLNGIYRYSGKPFIVTEFFAKGLDAIDANGYKLATSAGAGILVFTQEDRATYYEHYVLNLLETKACVGWVWYRFRDNDQSLYTVTLADGTTYENVKLLSTAYGENAYPNSLMTADGTLHWLSEFYSGDPKNWSTATVTVGGETKKVFTQTYSGERLASNQNINKGFYNNNFSSVVTVYTYNTDGKLRTFLYEDENSTMTEAELLTFGSVSYEVEDPESANATELTSKDGTQTFKVGKIVNEDGTYTITELTVYKGRYIKLTDKVKEVSDNLVDLIQYFK